MDVERFVFSRGEVDVEAVQLSGRNGSEVAAWVEECGGDPGLVKDAARSDWVVRFPGAWLVTNAAVFADQYRKASEDGALPEEDLPPFAKPEAPHTKPRKAAG